MFIINILKHKKMRKILTIGSLKTVIAVVAMSVFSAILMSSSHREAPLIANDPLADNTDLYAFRDPNNTDKIIIIANYIPSADPPGYSLYVYPGNSSVFICFFVRSIFNIFALGISYTSHCLLIAIYIYYPLLC